MSLYMMSFAHLAVSRPCCSIALSVIYRVTVVPRHTPNSSHLVAMATGHCTLKGKVTHKHEKPSYLQAISNSRYV